MKKLRKAPNPLKVELAAAIRTALAESNVDDRGVRVERPETENDEFLDVYYHGAFWRLEITGPWDSGD